MSAAQRLWKGSVRARATGAQVERLLNVATSHGVVLRNVRREGSRALTFEVDYQSFFKLRPAFRTTGCKVRILKRRGVPHLRAKMRFRAFFALGAVACLLIVAGMMQMVWDVRVVGDLDVEQRVIADETLAGMGIKPGMMRGEVDSHAIADTMEGEIGGVTFVGARMRGLILEVEIISSIETPPMIDHNAPADIVADVAGTIERIMVLEGTAAVRAGQEVRPGDVLIEGWALGPGGEIDVHALGEVVVRVWARGEGEAPLKRQVSTPTGRYENRQTLMLCGYPLPIHGESSFQEYSVASRETQILPGLYLPASVVTETLHEMQIAQLPRNEDEVRREAEQSAILAALKSIGNDTTIVDKRVEFSKMKDTTLYAAVSLQYLKTTGVERAR